MSMMETRLAVARDHPAFAGHFPGRPIVPAVVILAEVMAAMGQDREWDIAQAKFLRPVGPGDALVLRHEAHGAQVRFEVRSGEHVVATGALAPRTR
jgi:3-hydroxyacyl-[acyl-carrier-protein] dehydratase